MELAFLPGEERLTLTRHPLNGSTIVPTTAPAYVLVIEEGSSRMVPLPASGELVIGRATDAGLRLDDASVSRRHAKLVISSDAVLVVDLGSHNGTQVNGEQVQSPRALYSGDVVTLCSSHLVFHRASRPSLIRQVLDVHAFRQRAEEEIERALRYDRPATLICARFAAEPERRAVGDALAEKLRIIDSACWSGRGELLLMLPEFSPQQDGRPQLVDALTCAFEGTRIGAAVCPDDGADVDAIIGAARAAAEGASPGAFALPVEVAQTRTVGGRTLVLADPAMLRIYALIDKLGPSELPVLIGGETGVGKELIAHALHKGSRRSAGPFRSINCAALPEGLAESELFGHARGAFSGAVNARAGIFESARGGTVFLDEIGELAAPVQAKLLRVLETRRLTRIGEVEERSIDVRIVAATHRDLPGDIAAGRFREDLFYRLGAARIVLPPLRDRPQEIAILANTFLTQACAANERAVMTLSSGAVAALRAHRWPGNVRELKNVMELVAATVVERVVQPWHLEAALEATPAASTPGSALPTEVCAQTQPVREAAPDASPFRAIDDEIRELEITRMEQAMEAAGGVKKRAAELLSMPLRTFNTKYKLYQLPARKP